MKFQKFRPRIPGGRGPPPRTVKFMNRTVRGVDRENPEFSQIHGVLGKLYRQGTQKSHSPGQSTVKMLFLRLKL